MHKAKELILTAFQKSGSGDLSTSQLVKAVYQKEMQQIEQELSEKFISQDAKEKILDQKAKLHRRLTHHIQSLIDDDILLCTKILAKGEKTYAPKMNEGQELVLQSKQRKIILSRPQLPSIPMEVYEQKQVLHKILETDWSTRLNALLVEGRLIRDDYDLQTTITQMFSSVNDVVGINHVEDLLEREYFDDVMRSLEIINDDAVMMDRRCCLIIDVTHIKDPLLIERYVKKIIEQDFKNIIIIFDVTSREFIFRSQFFEKIIAIYAKHKSKLNIKNDDLLDAPLFVGKAGPYTFDDHEWQNFKKSRQSSTLAVGCGLASVVVDVKEFFDQFKQAHIFEESMLHVAKSLFIANTQLRMHAEEYLQSLTQFSKDRTIDPFSLARNFIRLWNSETSDESTTKNRLITLQDVKNSLYSYNKTQEIIYMSCGMPIRFKAEFSIAYRRFDKNKILPQQFETITVQQLSDLYNDQNKQRLLLLEQYSQIMNYVLEVRFNRTGTIIAPDVFRELTILLTTYQLPFYCYHCAGSLEHKDTLQSFVDK